MSSTRESHRPFVGAFEKIEHTGGGTDQFRLESKPGWRIKEITRDWTIDDPSKSDVLERAKQIKEYIEHLENAKYRIGDLFPKSKVVVGSTENEGEQTPTLFVCTIEVRGKTLTDAKQLSKKNKKDLKRLLCGIMDIYLDTYSRDRGVGSTVEIAVDESHGKVDMARTLAQYMIRKSDKKMQMVDLNEVCEFNPRHFILMVNLFLDAFNFGEKSFKNRIKSISRLKSDRDYNY